MALLNFEIMQIRSGLCFFVRSMFRDIEIFAFGLVSDIEREVLIEKDLE
jgi:hypothetical protein